MKAQREGQAGDGGMVGKCNDFQFFGGGVLWVSCLRICLHMYSRKAGDLAI